MRDSNREKLIAQVRHLSILQKTLRFADTDATITDALLYKVLVRRFDF